MRTAIPFVRIVFGIALLTATTAPTSTATPEPNVASLPDDCLPKYPPPPVLKLKVRVPDCAASGQAIEYRICVENCSTAEAHHVVVKNALPRNVKYVSADPLPTKHGDELHWPLGTIGGGAVREIRLVLQPTNKEDVKNCIRVAFEHGQCLVTRQALRPGEMQPPLIGEPVRPKIEVVPEAKTTEKSELDLKIFPVRDQYVNLPAKYLIQVTNTGKTRAKSVLVTARLPAALKVQKKTTEPHLVVDNEVAWQLGTLEPGGSKMLTLVVKATKEGEHCFQTKVLADLALTKEAEVCTRFVGVSAMSVEMYDTKDPLFVGDKTSYLVMIRNPGSAALTNVQIKAFVPSALRALELGNFPGKQFPVQGGMWLELPPAAVKAGDMVTYTFPCEAVSAGNTRFHVEISADQLIAGRPVIEQESTSIRDDR